MFQRIFNFCKTNKKVIGLSTTTLVGGILTGVAWSGSYLPFPSKVEFKGLKVAFDKKSNADVDRVLKLVSDRNCKSIKTYSKINTDNVQKKNFVLDQTNIRYYLRTADLFLVSTTVLDILNKKYICFNGKGLGTLMTAEAYQKYYEMWKIQLRNLGVIHPLEKFKREIGQGTSYKSRDEEIKKIFKNAYPKLKKEIEIF